MSKNIRKQKFLSALTKREQFNRIKLDMNPPKISIHQNITAISNFQVAKSGYIHKR